MSGVIARKSAFVCCTRPNKKLTGKDEEVTDKRDKSEKDRGVRKGIKKITVMRIPRFADNVSAYALPGQ